MESVVLLLGSNDVAASTIVEQAIEALRSDVADIAVDTPWSLSKNVATSSHIVA
jgi:hypothetical protein